MWQTYFWTIFSPYFTNFTKNIQVSERQKVSLPSLFKNMQRHNYLALSYIVQNRAKNRHNPRHVASKRYGWVRIMQLSDSCSGYSEQLFQLSLLQLHGIFGVSVTQIEVINGVNFGRRLLDLLLAIGRYVRVYYGKQITGRFLAVVCL